MTLLFLSCLCYCSPKKYVSFFIYFILCFTFILLHVLLYPHHNTNYFFLNKKLIMGIMVITILLIWRRAFLYRFGCQKVFLAVLLGRWHKKYCARLVVRSIPMSLLRRKSCSALASTILESPLHRTKATCTIFFCAICQAALPGRPFDTRIL